VDQQIETVKRLFDAFARRDVEASLELMHPEIRLWAVTARATGDGPYVGHEGIRRYMQDVERLWQELELRPIGFEEVADTVVVLGEVHARGAAGKLRQPTIWTLKLRDRLVIQCRVDSDTRAARRALGIECE
jgi:ketosteroid isomerase-like protein